MFQSILEWLLKGLASLFDLVVASFVGALQPSLSKFIEIFPSFAVAYSAFQTIGYGFTICIAGCSLYQFFFTSGVNPQSKTDPPWVTLFRVAVSAALIWSGGYILTYLVDTAKLAYNFFASMEYSQFEGSVFSVFSDISAMDVAVLLGGTGAAILAPGVSVLAISGALMFLLLVVGILAIQLLMLMLEIAQRYILIGVLVYTSPLIFPTYASYNTAQIFRKWCQMFLSSLILLTLNVFVLNAAIGALMDLPSSDEGFFIKFILILALIKVGQQLDNYLHAMGLATPRQTGAGLLATIAASAGKVGRFGMSVANSNTVLGRAVHGAMATSAQSLKSVGAVIHAGQAAHASGGSFVEGSKAAIKEQFKASTLGKFTANTGESFGTKWKNNAKGSIDNASYILSGKRPFADKAAEMAKEQQANEKQAATANRTIDNKMHAQGTYPDNAPVDTDIVSKALEHEAKEKEMKESYERSGIGEVPASIKNGDMTLSAEATAANLHMLDGDIVTGPDAPLQKYMDAMTSMDDAAIDAAAYAVAEDEYGEYINEPVFFPGSYYYDTAQDDLAQDDTTRSYGHAGNMLTYAEAQKAVNDTSAVKEGGYYYNAAKADLPNNAPVQQIENEAAKMQEGDRTRLHTATVSAATTLRNNDVQAVQYQSNAYAYDYKSSTIGTIENAKSQTVRNVLATTEIPDSGVKQYSNDYGNALIERAYGDRYEGTAVEHDNEQHSKQRFDNVRIEKADYAPGVSSRTLKYEYVGDDGVRYEATHYDEVAKQYDAVPAEAEQVVYRFTGNNNRSATATEYIYTRAVSIDESDPTPVTVNAPTQQTVSQPATYTQPQAPAQTSAPPPIINTQPSAPAQTPAPPPIVNTQPSAPVRTPAPPLPSAPAQRSRVNSPANTATSYPQRFGKTTPNGKGKKNKKTKKLPGD